MERKPIKRNEHIAKLSRDHHASLMFCWKLRQGVRNGVPVARMVPYIEYFAGHHFIHHFQEEEEILFAPLQDEKVQKAVEDHVVILRQVGEIVSEAERADYDTLSILADLVDNHVRYEERILFPHLEQLLSQDQLEKIGRQLDQDPIKDLYEDTFWIKEK